MSGSTFFNVGLWIPADPTTQEVVDAINESVKTKEDTKDLFATLCEIYHGEEWFNNAVLEMFTTAMKRYQDEIEEDMFGC